MRKLRLTALALGLLAAVMPLTALPAGAGDGITPGVYRGQDKESAPRTEFVLKIKGNRLKVVSIDATIECVAGDPPQQVQLGDTGFVRVKRGPAGGDFRLKDNVSGYAVEFVGGTRDQSVRANFSILSGDGKCADFGLMKANRK
jgi:hypothetical protein